MKAFMMYAMAILGGYAFSELSQLWFGGEWIFGILIVAWFALFLQVWERLKPGGAGLILVTLITLLNIGYVFFVQYSMKAIFSFLIGLLLIRFYKGNKDVVLTSLAITLSYIAINAAPGNQSIMWSLFLIGGVSTLIGFRYQFQWLKRCFIAVFGIAALFLLVLNFTVLSDVLVFALLLGVIGLSYKYSRYRVKTAK